MNPQSVISLERKAESPRYDSSEYQINPPKTKKNPQKTKRNPFGIKVRIFQASLWSVMILYSSFGDTYVFLCKLVNNTPT